MYTYLHLHRSAPSPTNVANLIENGAALESGATRIITLLTTDIDMWDGHFDPQL